MSDALAFTPNPAACARLEAFVRDRGGAAFFDQPGARETLAPMLADVGGTSESEADRDRAIEAELASSRATLEQRLGHPVKHVCLPWGVTSDVRVPRAGKTRFLDRGRQPLAGPPRAGAR